MKVKKETYNNKLCNNKMSFDDCELAVLRHAVDETEKKQGAAKVNNEDVKQILNIVEDFLRKKKLICYGGTAINNILPKQAQFYKRDIQIPDYDFFSDKPIDDAKELSDIYLKNGFSDVEAKSGVHYGTFKVFVNYIPIADITFLHPTIFKNIQKDAIKINGIRYAPPNFLRMSMYLELSRPDGDVSRWEKVLKRLALLNKYHPLENKKCENVKYNTNNDSPTSELNTLIRDTIIDNDGVFFGGYSSYLYSKYMDKNEKDIMSNISDFDILSEDPMKLANIIVERLKDNDIKHVKHIHHKEIGEIIPEHCEIKINDKSYVVIYKTIACHSYNKITISGRAINVASIETILSFYLAFAYSDHKHHKSDRLLCMSNFLINVIEKNKLSSRGILKRFTVNCYGKQKTLEDIRSEKALKFKEFNDLKVDYDDKDYQMWFLKYNPSKTTTKKSKQKTRKIPSAVKSVKSKTLRNRLLEIFE
jgi:hypothetical protein